VKPILLGVLGIAYCILAYYVVRYVRKQMYFRGEEFLAHKVSIAAFVAEHNEVSSYVAEIRAWGLFTLGASTSRIHSRLASTENTSQWKYRRDRNVMTEAPNVHSCSLQIARNASTDPVKYVMKYFNVNSDESTLRAAEALGDSITRLEDAVENLQGREASITEQVSPPPFIKKHYLDEFMKQVGVELSPITVPYPVYIFEYVSAGGNSSQRTPVTLNNPMIDALIETLGSKIRLARSVAGQRKLMTTKLREAVKVRDNYTCQKCGISVADEPHLLIEVDHKVPVSKGGFSVMENLQALCWRCNRTKSNRV
jgi:hypothetical protein